MKFLLCLNLDLSSFKISSLGYSTKIFKTIWMSLFSLRDMDEDTEILVPHYIDYWKFYIIDIFVNIGIFKTQNCEMTCGLEDMFRKSFPDDLRVSC